MSLPLAARCAFGHQHDLTKDRTLPFACLHGCTVRWYAAIVPPWQRSILEEDIVTFGGIAELRSLCMQCGQTGFWA